MTSKRQIKQTLWITNDNITIQQLPSDYCNISSIEGNVLNVTFDFSYFDSHSQYLELYPAEFQSKYNAYQKERQSMRWQELDSPTSFAIKCNNDILEYALPPFAGLLREVYDLEDLNCACKIGRYGGNVMQKQTL